jgi:hypothetical protein
VQAALVLDPVALELWREGWEDGGDPILAAWHGVHAGGGDPEEARSAVEGAIADGGARQAFLAGLLAQSVGEHEAAISAFEVADRARMSIDVFSPDWAVRTRSWLARARSYEALGDSVSARSYYSRFAEAWREADPEVAHLREEATAAMNRLRVR